VPFAEAIQIWVRNSDFSPSIRGEETVYATRLPSWEITAEEILFIRIICPGVHDWDKPIREIPRKRRSSLNVFIGI